jgi:predicted kinase
MSTILPAALRSLRAACRAGTPPPLEKLIQILGDVVPWLEQMADTPQDPEWHGEGNVAIHTQWVLRELTTLFTTEAARLTPDEREILLFATLFHDMGKVATTRHEEGRIVSPHHPAAGCNYLVYRLPELGLPYPMIREVMALVRYHHHPTRLVADDAPESAYRRLARQVNTEWVYWLERADMQGRITPDGDAHLHSLELFRLFCEEYGVWGNRDPYAGWRTIIHDELSDYPPETREFVVARAIEDYEAGLIFTPYEAIAISYQYRDTYGELVLTVAPGGAGKSTWVAYHLAEYELISMDAWRTRLAGKRADQSRNSAVVQAAREHLKGLLREGKKVVWDATSIRRIHRDKLLGIARDYGAKTTLVAFQLARSLLLQRNEEREDDLPTDVLNGQINGIEWVEVTEAHEVKYVDGE